MPVGELGGVVEVGVDVGVSDDGGGELGGDEGGELGGDEGGLVVVGVVGGGGESDRGEPGGVQPGGDPGGGGGGGGSTVVVGWPSGPTLTTVVGGWLDGSCPGAPLPGMVIGLPGWPLPWTTWIPGVVPCPPLGRLVPPAASGVGPANSATIAKAVATTSPLTPSTT